MADAASRPAALPAPRPAGRGRAGRACRAPRAPPGMPQPQPRPQSRPNSRRGAALTHLLRAAAEREKGKDEPRPPLIAAPGRTPRGLPALRLIQTPAPPAAARRAERPRVRIPARTGSRFSPRVRIPMPQVRSGLRENGGKKTTLEAELGREKRH